MSVIYKEEVHGIRREPLQIEVEIVSAIYVLKSSGMWEASDQLSEDEMDEIVSSVINKTNNKFHILQISFIIQVELFLFSFCFKNTPIGVWGKDRRRVYFHFVKKTI